MHHPCAELIDRIRLDPANPDLYFELTHAAYRLGDYRLAEEAIGGAIGIDPANGIYRLTLARIHLADRAWARAETCYRELRDAWPEMAEIHAELARSLEAQGRTGEAIASYRKALALDGDDAYSHHRLAGLVADATPAKARDHLVRSLQLCPENGEGWHRLGLIERRIGRLDDAIDALRRAARLVAESHAITLDLARTLHAAGCNDEAITLYHRLINNEPENAMLHRELGDALLAGGHPGQACAVLRRALALDADDIATYDALTAACARHGLDEEALRHGREALRRKDRQVRSAASPCTAFTPSVTGGVDLVLFALADADRLDAARLGVVRCREHLPDWRVRVYIADDLPPSARDALSSAGATLVDCAADQREHAATWPLAALHEPGVRFFLCRDLERPVDAIDRAAVDEWLASGLPFHAMRREPTDTEPVVPGLWGGTAGLLPAVRPTLEHPPREGLGPLLRREVWPRIRGRCLVHDAHYDLFDARPLPDIARASAEPAA